MKERWEDEDGRINPLASVEANFHELPLRLKIQIIHRITEYRLDAKVLIVCLCVCLRIVLMSLCYFQDVENKLQGLNATDLRLEPLGCDRDGAKFWYFFGVRWAAVACPPEKKNTIGNNVCCSKAAIDFQIKWQFSCVAISH